MSFARMGSMGTGFGRMGRATPGPWWFPGATLDIDFARGWGMQSGLRKPLSDLLNTVRSSPKWAVDSTGLAREYPDNVAAINDFGALVEEARITLVPKARRLDDGAVWTLSSVTPSAVAGIDGVSGSATRLTATGSNGTITSPTTSLSSAARRLAPFIRRVAGTGNIDLSLDGGSTYTTLVGVTSSWQRLGIGQTLANPQIKIRIATSGDVVDIDFAGGETGSFDTSPIESTSAAATRAADAITVNNFSSWYGSPTGITMYAEFTIPQALAASSFPTLFGIWKAGDSSNNQMFIGLAQSVGKLAGANSRSGGVNPGRMDSVAAFVAGTATKAAFAVAASDRALVVNGATAVTSASGALPVGPDTAGVGQLDNAAFPNAYIRRLVFKPTRDANALMQANTT